MKKLIARGIIIFSVLFLILWVLGTFSSREDIELYVLDERNEGSFSQDLSMYFPDSAQRRAKLRVIVHEISRDSVIPLQVEWRVALAKAAAGAEDERIFIKLDSPTETSKKILRTVIEDEFTGSQRRNMFRRVIAMPVVQGDTEEMACGQLKDDWIYLDENFGGIALIIDDSTMELISDCLPGLITTQKANIN